MPGVRTPPKAPAPAPEAAKAFGEGLGDGVGVGVGAGAGVGVGAGGGGLASIVLGTSGVVFAVLPAYAPDEQARVHVFCHAAPGTWHAMGVMLSAAGSLSWLRGVLGADYGTLDDEAARWKPGVEVVYERHDDWVGGKMPQLKKMFEALGFDRSGGGDFRFHKNPRCCPRMGTNEHE